MSSPKLVYFVKSRYTMCTCYNAHLWKLLIIQNVINKWTTKEMKTEKFFLLLKARSTAKNIIMFGVGETINDECICIEYILLYFIERRQNPI